MASVPQRLAGFYLELRAIPVLLWSFSGVALGTGLGWDDGVRSQGWFLAAAAIGVLLQGLVAHSVNDVTDWRSGTDRDRAPRTLSGGSKVLPAGLLTEDQLHMIGRVAAGLAIAGGLAVAAARGWWMLALGAVGLVGALVYTLWPVRAAYRPFLGEAVAFTCVGACVIGGYGVQTGQASLEVALVAAAHASVCVGMLMLHHYLDRGPDTRAIPQKRTSVVRLGSGARLYATAWASLSALIFAVATFTVDRSLAWCAIAALITVAVQATTTIDDVRSVTRAELGVIGLGVTSSAVSTVAMAPPLAWILLLPPLVVVVEQLVARRFLTWPDPSAPGPQSTREG